MGEPKDTLRLDDGSFLDRIVQVLATCTSPVLVVRRACDAITPPSPALGISDEHPDRGPIEGLRCALQHIGDHTSVTALFLTACDMPFTSAAAVRWLSARLRDQDDAVAIQIDGVPQPFAAIYRRRVLPVVARMAADRRGLREVVDAVQTRFLTTADLSALDPECRFLTNVNTPAEYEAIRQRGRPGSA